MAEDADLFDVVPPSPIATSTQRPPQSIAGGFFPPLPLLPDLADDNGNAGPLAGASRPLDLSPIIEARSSQRSRTQPYDGSDRNTIPRRVSGAGLQDWLIRSTQGNQWQHVLQADPEVVEIQDNSDSDTTVTRGDSPIEEIVVDSDDNISESDIVNADDGISDSDIVVADDDISDGDIVVADDDISDGDIVVADDDISDSDIVVRPDSPVPPDNEVLILPDQPVEIPEGNFEREEVVATTDEPQVIDVLGEPAPVESAAGPTPAVPGTPGSVPVQRSAVHTLASGSPADFRSPKRRRVASPAKSAGEGKTTAAEEEEEEGETCPICFEPWTTSGGHRLSSLRCGHLFGQSCIEKWLKGQGGKCPHCNAKAKRQDIRVLYAKTIKAVDTTEKDRALQDLEKEREVRRRSEMDGAQLRLQYQQAIEENNSMRLEIERLKAQLRRAGGSTAPIAGTSRTMSKLSSQEQIAGRFALDKTIKIYDGGNCRVMTYCPSLVTLVASQPSSSQLFPGFGVKKINMLDVKASQYVTIHTKAIRDLAFLDSMLLSCGLDKKIKMTSLLSNAVVQSYDTPLPAWSCTWNTDDRNYFYAGLQNGQVLEFDVRNTEGPVSELNKQGSRSPVASLQYIHRDNSAAFRSGGVMVGQLDRVTFFESSTSEERRPHLMPMEGLLTSLCFEPDTRHILASFRPTARHPTIRHQLCEMCTRNISQDPTVIDNVCSCNVVHTFQEGRTQTVLSRSTMLPHPRDSNRLLVCGGDETSNCVHIWDSGTGQKLQSLMIGASIVDLCSYNISGTVYLAALTDKQCQVYKWT